MSLKHINKAYTRYQQALLTIIEMYKGASRMCILHPSTARPNNDNSFIMLKDSSTFYVSDKTSLTPLQGIKYTKPLMDLRRFRSNVKKFLIKIFMNRHFKEQFAKFQKQTKFKITVQINLHSLFKLNYSPCMHILLTLYVGVKLSFISRYFP